MHRAVISAIFRLLFGMSDFSLPFGHAFDRLLSVRPLHREYGQFGAVFLRSSARVISLTISIVDSHIP